LSARPGSCRRSRPKAQRSGRRVTSSAWAPCSRLRPRARDRSASGRPRRWSTASCTARPIWRRCRPRCGRWPGAAWSRTRPCGPARPTCWPKPRQGSRPRAGCQNSSPARSRRSQHPRRGRPTATRRPARGHRPARRRPVRHRRVRHRPVRHHPARRRPGRAPRPLSRRPAWWARPVRLPACPGPAVPRGLARERIRHRCRPARPADRGQSPCCWRRPPVPARSRRTRDRRRSRPGPAVAVPGAGWHSP
jgi:hypothetical protein